MAKSISDMSYRELERIITATIGKDILDKSQLTKLGKVLAHVVVRANEEGFKHGQEMGKF